MNSTQLTIGLFGFGVVGEGIYQVLNQTPSLQARIKKICIKHADKKRNANADLFTTSYEELLNDEEINVIIELISDADEAYKIVTAALSKKKAVVSANKKLIAEHLPELLQLQKKHETPFLYEAAVCGSIPIIRNLEEYYDNDLLQSICGIVNGSTNFILTKILDEKLSYPQALLLAKGAGFAEADPTLDVKGIDAANKLTILLAHAYGVVVHPRDLLYNGITQIHPYDAAYAEEKGLRIKLTAQAKKLGNGKIAAFVLPQFVTPESQLFQVKNEYNGVVLETAFADKQFLYGKGAGRYPTSSAVLSDVSALRYEYKYEYRRLERAQQNELTEDFYLRLFVSYNKESDLNKEDFEWIDEAYQNEKRQYIIGAVPVQRLKRAPWLYSQNVSTIICPNGIIENIELRKLKKRSLELAGFSQATEFILN